MKELRFHPSAVTDLKESISFYEGKYTGLGTDFLNEVQRTIKEINKFPDRFPRKTQSTRHCLLKKFPYSIVYLDFNDNIYIVAIAHWKRRPNYWKKRLS